MKLSTFLLSSILLFTATLHAQQTPWSNQPVTKKVSTFMGTEKQLRLTLDTLLPQKEEDIPPYSFLQLNNWYGEPDTKVGYGYVTEEGKPFGIWRYYTVKGNHYELFCEGYFETLTPDHLIITEENKKDLSAVDLPTLVEEHTNSLETRRFFTGEWRFYKNGKLEKIIQADNKVKLEIDVADVYNPDNLEVTSIQYSLKHPGKRHLSGIIVSTIHFSHEGYITKIFSNGLNLKFSKEGKPVIEPLYEPDFLGDY